MTFMSLMYEAMNFISESQLASNKDNRLLHLKVTSSSPAIANHYLYVTYALLVL